MKLTAAAILLILMLSAGILAQESDEDITPATVAAQTTPPAIFQFMFESDFVVIGSTSDLTSVGKRVKKPELDLGDYTAALINDFQAEEVLFSKELFDSNSPLSNITVNNFSIFNGPSDWKVLLNRNKRYLLFIKRLPVDDPSFIDLELDKDKPYYRVYRGTQTIFPGRGSPMHGTFNFGIIELSKGAYPEIVEAIRQFSKALSYGDKSEMREHLRHLTMSDNEILRENAKYALERSDRVPAF